MNARGRQEIQLVTSLLNSILGYCDDEEVILLVFANMIQSSSYGGRSELLEYCSDSHRGEERIQFQQHGGNDKAKKLSMPMITKFGGRGS